MTRKYVFFINLILLCIAQLPAQTIERTVIATAGDVYENTAGRLSFTIGETVTDYYLLQTHLCQGFQQSEAVDVPLPFGLIDFSGYRIDKNWVHLDWQTDFQEDLDYFILERRNAVSDEFIFISKHSKAAANNYKSRDENNAAKESFYRLKCYQKDGSFQYSNVIVINGTPLENFVAAQPNPTTGAINLQIAPDARQNFSEIKLTISNTHGKTLHQQLIPISQQNVSISHLRNYPAGIYYFTISTNTNYREFIKVIKSDK